MANYRANKTFFHAGEQIHNGDLLDSTHELVSLYPANFTADQDVDYLNSGGTLTGDLNWSGTLGPVLHATTGTLSYRITVNAGGTLLTEAP